MWLFTKAGFFSVVRHSHLPGHLLVRARVREDIDQLARLLAEITGRSWTPVVTPDADYRYRLEVPREDFSRVATRLVEDIDYPNFKLAVHGNPNRDRAYGRVWSVMAELQEDEVYLPRAAGEPTPEEGETAWEALAGDAPSEEIREATNDVRRKGDFFVKFPGFAWELSDEPPEMQLLVEFLAYRLYARFGVRVPEARLVREGRRLGLATRAVFGPSVGAYLRSRNADLEQLGELPAAGDVFKGFYVDVLLANWDVVGQTGDNLLLAADGVYRIDPGGALTFRASGDRKGEAFGDFPGELTTMKDPGVSTAGGVFGRMSAEHEQHATGVFRAVDWLALRDVIEEARAAVAAEAPALEQRDPAELIQAADAEFTAIAAKLEARRGAILRHLAGDGPNG